MATSTITIISGASSITLDNTVSTITLGSSGPQGAPGEGVPIGGTAGQILQKDSATDYDTSWIDNFTTDVRVTVKNDSGSTLPKGTVVYVSGANGTNILVKPAIATSDATSATTIGFLLQSLAANASGYVITQGTITGLNTSAGTAGDPVWLSPTVAGGVVYGVANKPQAPNHLYSLGVLTRSNVNNGEIQVFVNNGWELEELHNVKITSPTNGQVLTYDSAQSLWVNSSETGDISAVNVTSPITGGGTSGAVTIGHAASGVGAGYYGGAATVPTFTVDSTGHLTSAVDVPIAIAPSQVANLTTDLAGKAALASANAFTVGGHTITNTVAATIPLQITAAASQSGDIQQWRNSSANVLVKIDSVGTLGAFRGAYISTTYGATGQNSAITAQPATATVIGAVVKGAASQSANLTEWQDSSGGVLGKVEYGGALALLPTAATNGYTLFTRNPAAGVIGHIIRGAASQTANLQEWQNSGGTAVALVDNNGGVRGSTVYAGNYAYLSAYLNVVNSAPSVIGAVIRGAAAQTANLQEWQNSAGTVQSWVDSTGTIGAQYFTNRTNSTNAFLDWTTNTFKVVNRTAASVPFAVKGVASQSGNLTEWQNSGGANVATVSASGVGLFANLGTNTGYMYTADENSGGYVRLTKQTAAAANPASGQAKLYLRDGTTAGTLKLVVRAGAAGAETTILDNIPQ